MFFNLAIAGQSRTSAIRDEAARLAERQHCTLAESENILKSAPTHPPKKL
jgi:hypothetical protein